MKFSEKWLRGWVDPSLTTGELVAQITMAGLEVDAVEPVAGDFSGVVVGQIMAIQAHPDADKLKVCSVAFGTENTVQVVCGAPNAVEGLKVPFAQVGAILPGDFKIKKAKLRGVESFGMLCGASELGMEDLVDGLMVLPSNAPIGQCIREYLNLDDTIIDVDLTPNRGDCLSIEGIARDVSVLNKIPLNAIQVDAVVPTVEDTLAVTVSEQSECPSYLGRVIQDVDLTSITPLWITEKLRRSDIRSIDPIVDVTNYVLLELGQPMHAFDLDTLEGGIEVRKAKNKEVLTLLNDQELELDEGSLVIADQSKPLALAGIMGGKQSAVSQSTRAIFLESAFFSPIALAGRARSFGLHTDSSHRFERGVDWQLQEKAMERATQLILDIAGGNPGPLVKVSNGYESTADVVLTRKKLDQMLGVSLDSVEIESILCGLGLNARSVDEGWQCKIPSYRFDLSIEADLIEEVARIFGYNNLPTRELRLPVTFKPNPESVAPIRDVKRQLVSLGYQEAITYSFTEPAMQQWFTDSESIVIANPISKDMSVMRNSLLPGLVQSLQHNLNRQQSRVRLFESGLTFNIDDRGYQQNAVLAGVVFGNRQPEGWSNTNESVDFFDIKGDVESLLAVIGVEDYRFQGAKPKGFHPGQVAELLVAEKSMGYIGAIHPQLLKTIGINDSVFVFELSLDILRTGQVPNFKVISKFPLVRRDLALIVDESLEAAQLVDLVNKDGGEYLKTCIVFDLYAGVGVEKGKKSVGLGLTFQHPDRSLNDEEIQLIVDKVTLELADTYGAFLRN